MPFIAAKDGTQLYYKDWGQGPPVVLIPGWPLDADMWEAQAPALASSGRRVISYDRRGFGRSDQPWTGYDYDTMSDDLAAIIQALSLTDVALVGFSMGGGEIARYMSRHGGKDVSKAVLVSSICPFLLETADHPNGAPKELFDGIVKGLEHDRPGFLQDFLKKVFGVGLLSSPISSAALQWTLNLAMRASPKATVDCVRAFSATDLRIDMPAFKVPTLIIHGDSDETVPLDISEQRGGGDDRRRGAKGLRRRPPRFAYYACAAASRRPARIFTMTTAFPRRVTRNPPHRHHRQHVSTAFR